MAFSLPITQLAPWQRRGLAPFTTTAAALLELEWDGTLQVGSPADLIMLKATNWAQALSTPPHRQVIIKGEWLNENDNSIIKHIKSAL